MSRLLPPLEQLSRGDALQILLGLQGPMQEPRLPPKQDHTGPSSSAASWEEGPAVSAAGPRKNYQSAH